MVKHRAMRIGIGCPQKKIDGVQTPTSTKQRFGNRKEVGEDSIAELQIPLSNLYTSYNSNATIQIRLPCHRHNQGRTALLMSLMA